MKTALVRVVTVAARSNVASDDIRIDVKLKMIDPRRQKTLQLIDASTSNNNLCVTTEDINTANVVVRQAPITTAHLAMCMTRTQTLAADVCRPVDVDNLFFVAQYPRDLSRMRKWPFTHQVQDVERVLQELWFFIASEMRTGKSKIVIDAAQYLFEAQQIDQLIVVAPAPVRDVWADQQLGQLSAHLWLDVAARIIEYHGRVNVWHHGPVDAARTLDIYVTNFEFLRKTARLIELLALCNKRTLLVGDESSFLKSYKSLQTEAFVELRKRCGRVVLLNGTPIFHTPLDLFSQGNILHASILQCPYITYFKSRYAIEEPVLTHGGKPLTKVVGKGPRAKEIIIKHTAGWTNLDDLQRRFAPYTVRRLQADCLDLPPKLDPVTLTAVLTTETWRAYKDMRDELVVWLKTGNVATSATAAIKSLRLSQITSGFLGGIEDANIGNDIEEGLLESLDLGLQDVPCFSERNTMERVTTEVPKASSKINTIQEIGREKLDVLLWFIEQRFEADANLHLVTWCRFRPELFRLLEEVSKKFPRFDVASIHGSQKKSERLRALALLKPETSPTGPVFVGGIEGTGSFGLDFTAAHTCVTSSSGYSPGRSAQTLDRVYGPGQTEPIAYFEIMAVGPKGQRTIDHAIITARRAGEDIATWTADAWVEKLLEE
jgi:hypothetical protein